MNITKHIPNSITSLNLFCGSVAVILSFYGEFKIALFCMIAAAIFDFCDGFAARLLKAYSPMGKELDSLADMVSFGLAPSCLAFNKMLCIWNIGFNKGSFNRYYNADNVRLFSNDTVYNSQRIQG